MPWDIPTITNKLSQPASFVIHLAPQGWSFTFWPTPHYLEHKQILESLFSLGPLPTFFYTLTEH